MRQDKQGKSLKIYAIHEVNQTLRMLLLHSSVDLASIVQLQHTLHIQTNGAKRGRDRINQSDM